MDNQTVYPPSVIEGLYSRLAALEAGAGTPEARGEFEAITAILERVDP